MDELYDYMQEHNLSCHDVLSFIDRAVIACGANHCELDNLSIVFREDADD
jgi:hypothetical protein